MMSDMTPPEKHPTEKYAESAAKFGRNHDVVNSYAPLA